MYIRFLFFCGLLFVLSGCESLIPKKLRSVPPSCPSDNYSGFMGKTKEFVQSQNLKDRYIFIGEGIELPPRDDTRVSFNVENNIITGIGCF